METIKLKVLFHNETECIGIFSKQNATLNAIFKNQVAAKWSRTHTCWYVPLTKKNYELLTHVLKGKANLQTEILKEYLQKKKKVMLLILLQTKQK